MAQHSGPPDWAALGGWSQRFARVVVEARNGTLAFGLIDTNGDGHKYAAIVAYLDGEHEWVPLYENDDAAPVGRWWNPEAVCVWGQDSRQASATYEYAGVRHTVRADRSGWWALVLPADPSTLPNTFPVRCS